MHTSVQFAWQILYRAGKSFLETFPAPHIASTEKAKGWLNSISATDAALYQPLLATPKNLFHSEVRKKLQKTESLTITENRFPYRIQTDLTDSPIRVGLSVKIFLPDILSLRLICYDSVALDKSIVFKQRQLANHKNLISLLDSAAHTISPGSQKLEAKPIIKIKSPDPEFLAKESRFLAALLINHEGSSSGGSIADFVLEKNREHNRKNADHRVILIDKQGFLAAQTPHPTEAPNIDIEIEKKAALYELGTILKCFYAEFRSIRHKNLRAMDWLYIATTPYIENPEVALFESVTNQHAWKLTRDEFRLVGAYDMIKKFLAEEYPEANRIFKLNNPPIYDDLDYWKKMQTPETAQDKHKNSGPVFHIQTNTGPIAIGSHAAAHNNVLNASQRDDLEKLCDSLQELRVEISQKDSASAAEFDRALASLKQTISKKDADPVFIHELLACLHNIAEGTIGGIAASGILGALSSLSG